MPKDLKYRNGQGCYTHRTSLQIGERTKRQGARQTEKSRWVDAAQMVNCYLCWILLLLKPLFLPFPMVSSG